MKKKIIVGITGSSGAVYGVKLLQMLQNLDIESHLVISKAANITIATELEETANDITKLANHTYKHSDIAAPISSGSFCTDGMIIAPCSMKTLSAIANGYESDLITRAASVTMKEQKKLVLMVRETPLHAIHLENMLKLSKAGVAISPPVPAFYNKPNTIDDIVTHSVARVLDLFDLDAAAIKRWKGFDKSTI